MRARSLYILKGDDRREDNYINISAIMFMWCTLPAFGAAAYIPSLVQGAHGHWLATLSMLIFLEATLGAALQPASLASGLEEEHRVEKVL